MGTIADKLTYLNATKAAIKNAIVNKGVSVSDTDTFRSYADKIASIETGGIEDVATADEMTALLIADNVGKVYRFTGSTDSTYTNGDLYEVMQEEIADPLAGTWVFNNSLNYGSFSSFNYSYNINFTSNGTTYNELSSPDPGALPNIGIDLCYNSTTVYNTKSGWTNTAYKTINITSKLSEVTDGDTLLAWLQANATKQ